MSAKRAIVIGDDNDFLQEVKQSLGGIETIALPASAAATQIAACAGERAGPVAFVFAPCQHDEAAEFAAALDQGSLEIADVIAVRLKGFASQLQAAINCLLPQDGGQIWVCDYDDTFAYHATTANAPILAQARASAVRSVAKEYARMGVLANSLIIQPTREMLGGPAAERQMRDLRVYASRFKSQPMAHVTDYLGAMMGMPTLPFNGAVVSAGVNVDQSHLIQ